jgi:predicted enzyme related to lactoylglutathione lyase
MEVDLFAGVAVSDFDRAVAWFGRLFGVAETFRAHDTDYVWTLAEHRSIYVKLRPEDAGHAMVLVFVDDLDGFVASAASRGMHPETRETYGNGVRKVIYTDPDGNEVGFGGAPVEDGAAGR